jgi:hypothetical protein
VVDDDVASFTCGLGSNNAFGGNNLSSERSLVLVHIDRNSGLVPIWRSLKEVLLGIERCAVRGNDKREDDEDDGEKQCRR